MNLEEELLEAEHIIDRFQIYEMLLLSLEHVRQDPRYHPEGDALYHSLQVFALAEREQAYDEEFLLAALLHDVGKGIDPFNHVQSGLEALEGYITERTAWLIEHHMEAHQIFSGTCGQKLLHRLQANENYADLMLLEECDRRGREKNVTVPELSEVLETLRELSRQCDM
jgi:HD superfamily phosphodiesterase